MNALHARPAALCLIMLLAAAPSPAQGFGSGSDYNETRPVQFGFGGGVIIPRTDAKAQDVLVGAAGQAFVLLRIAPGFPAIRVGADFSRMKFGTARTTVAGTPVGATRTQLAGIASLRFDLSPGPVRPYILLGVGAFNLTDALATGGETLATTQFGLDGGAGLSFRLGRIRGFAETRLQNVYTKQGGLISTKSIQAFPVTFGLIF